MLKRTGVTAVVLGGACLALGIAFVQVRGQNREAQDAMQAELRQMREAMTALRSAETISGCWYFLTKSMTPRAMVFISRRKSRINAKFSSSSRRMYST